MINLNLIMLVAVGVVGSGVLIALLRGQGQGNTRIEIDGRTFQFPQWVVSAITRFMETEENQATIEVGQWQMIVHRTELRLRTIPARTGRSVQRSKKRSTKRSVRGMQHVSTHVWPTRRTTLVAV